MSKELNVYHHELRHNEYAEFCLKYEVDKVIAEKDEEIDNIKYSRDEWAKACNQKDKEIEELKGRLASAEEDRDYFKNVRNKRHEEEIAELKKKLMPCLNGDCILTCEVVEKYGKENAELKQKLENAKATHYADSVDAGMRERRLKRALYKACANWAMNARMVEIESEPWGENHESRLWADVYDKCLKKAEEYK